VHRRGRFSWLFVHYFYPQIAQIFTDYFLTFFLICAHLRNLRINILFSFQFSLRSLREEFNSH